MFNGVDGYAGSYPIRVILFDDVQSNKYETTLNIQDILIEIDEPEEVETIEVDL